MEQALDLPVMSDPLVHVTKSRIKNNSRKYSVPSRSHLKRNLASMQLQNQNKGQAPESMADLKKVPTKLPPPPVPKKPKINLSFKPASSSINSTNIGTQESNNSPVVGSNVKEKPAIAPKPALPMKPSIVAKPVIERPSSLESKQSSADNGLVQVSVSAEKTHNKQQNKELGSPSKASLSFSERLKASSLSRRKDANLSNGKSRSHMISPVRRGSRTFMSFDSSPDSYGDAKVPVFKRFSSQTSLKSDEGSLDGLLETGLDLDDFENLKITPVVPLSVNSVLSPGNSFEEDEQGSKDSFDTRELNILGESDTKPDHFTYNADSNLDKVNGLIKDADGAVSSLSSGNAVEFIDFDPSESGEFVTSERRPMTETKWGFPGETSSSVRRANGNSKLGIRENANKPNQVLMKPSLSKEKSYNLNNIAISDSSSSKEPLSEMSSTVHVGNEENNNYVSINNKGLMSHSEMVGAGQNIKSVGDLKAVQPNFSDSESSLEYVTRDIDSNFSFELLSKQVKDKSIQGQQNGAISVTDGPPSLLQTQTQSSMDIDAQLTTFVENQEEDMFDDVNAFGEDVEIPFTKEDDILLHTDPNFDVEMLPIVPPPPMDEDDEDIFSSIIDPPTVYEDDSDFDVMEICPPPPPQAAPAQIDSDMTSQVFDANLPTKHLGRNYASHKFVEHGQSLDVVTNKLEEGFDETDLVIAASKSVNISKFPKNQLHTFEHKPNHNSADGDDKSAQFDESSKDLLSRDDSKDTVEANERKSVLSLAHKFETGVAGGKESGSRLPKKNTNDKLPHKEGLYEIGSSKYEYDSTPVHKMKKETTPLKLDGDEILGALRPNKDSKSVVLEETVKPFWGSKLDVESIPLHSLDSLENHPNTNIEKDPLEWPDSISEKGKQRRKSFSDKNAKVNVSNTNSNEWKDETTNEHIAIQPLKLGALMVKQDVLPEPPHVVVEGTSSKRRLSSDSLNNRIVVEETRIKPTDSLALKRSEYSTDDRSETNKARQLENGFQVSQDKWGLSSEELREPAGSSKLSPWSSAECLPDSGKPSSRKSSVSSSNRSGRDNFTHKRWSSFCSSSGDDQDDDKKVNIVKLMRERTLTQSSDVAVDFVGNTESAVELDFSVPLTSDKDENTSEMDSSEELIEDAFESRIYSLPLDQWTTDDVSDWLEMIGLVELRPQFEERNIGGPELLSIDLKLLDEMGITNLDDRELILSEIYTLKNPEDMDIEMSLLDALDNASGHDREKMLAILEALRMSSEDQENTYLPSPSPILSGGGKKNREKSKKGKGSYRRALSEYTSGADVDDITSHRSKSASPTRQTFDVEPGSAGREKGKKGFKKKSFLKGFSFRRNGSGRLARLFSSRKKLVDSSLKYLLQTSPQGIIKIWTQSVQGGCHEAKAGDANAVSLLVTSTTTAGDVAKTVLEKLEMIEDANCFYLVESHSSKSVPEVVIKTDDCPLVLQCRWPDAERYKFELKKKCEGSIIIVHSDENSYDERSVKIDTMMASTCAEVMTVALKKLQINDPVKSFSLYQMRNQKQDGTQDHQIPMEANLLKLGSTSSSRPSVYKLVRVNFLGSPEKSLKPDDNQRERIERLQHELREKREELFKSKKASQSFEKKLKDVMSQNEALNKQVIEQVARITELEIATEALRSEVGPESDGKKKSNTYENEISILSDKLSEKEREKKVLKEIIENLKTSLEETQGQTRELEKLHEMGLLASDEEYKALDKVKDLERDNQLLKGRIVQLENDALERKVETIECENRLKDENEELKSTVEQLEMILHASAAETDQMKSFVEDKERLDAIVSELRQQLENRDAKIASLRNTQIEKEEMQGKLQALQANMNKKDKQLEEMSELAMTNEELLDKVNSLEREVKQKDRLMSDALIEQRKFMELRREFGAVSKELAEKNEQIEMQAHESDNMHENLAREIESKNQTIDRLNFNLSDLRNSFAESEEERRLLKSKAKDLEVYLHEKEALDEMNDLQNELDNERKRTRRLENEIETRADEFSAVCKEKDSSNEGLRDHIESLEQSLIEKDSKILDIEFKLQKLERSLRDSENIVDDEAREKNRLTLAMEDASHRLAEFENRLAEYRRLVAEKDNIIKNMKGSQAKTGEALKRELKNAQMSLMEKESIIDKMRAKVDEERGEMKSRFETLQGLVAVKETKWKDKEARLVNERDEQQSRFLQLETRLKEKDSSARLLEAKVAKMEKVARDNMKKFEKFMSNKDQMLQKVKEESQKEIKHLQEKLRDMDEASKSNGNDSLLNRSGSIGKEFQIKLKQKEEENKQHKFLLERLMSVVNDKDPRILEEFESSFGESSPDKSDKQPLLRKANEDWC